MNFKKNNKQRSFLISTFVIVLLMAVQACGSKSASKSEEPVATDQDASGIYAGSGTGTFSGINAGAELSLSNIKGIVNGNRFMFFNIDTVDANKNVLYDGEITSITLTELVGTVDVYQGGNVVSLAVPLTSGVVNSRSSVKLTLATKGNFLGGTVNATFDLLYDNASTNVKIDSNNGANVWTSSNIFMAISLMTIANFDVSSSASYTYQSFNGTNQCNHLGQATVVTGVNVYIIAESIANNTLCNLDTPTPNYTGLMSVVDGTTGNDNEMWYAISNKTYSVFGILGR